MDTNLQRFKRRIVQNHTMLLQNILLYLKVHTKWTAMSRVRNILSHEELQYMMKTHEIILILYIVHGAQIYNDFIASICAVYHSKGVSALTLIHTQKYCTFPWGLHINFLSTSCVQRKWWSYCRCKLRIMYNSCLLHLKYVCSSYHYSYIWTRWIM